MRRTLPTAPFAAAALIGGYGMVLASGSRPLGGLVMVAVGAICVWVSTGRDSRAITLRLIAIAFVAFVCSHLLGLLIGAWPAVLLAACGTATACWRLSDARRTVVHARG